VDARWDDDKPVTFGPTFASLLTAAQSGAPWALERIYRELSPAVAGYLRVQGAAEAEDLTSDVFLKVFAGIVGFSGPEERFRSWVFTVAHNRLVDEHRRKARRPVIDGGELPDRAASPDDDAESETLRRMSVERVRRLCDQLVPDQRDVLLLRMVGDLSLEQTAEALGKSVGAVKALQHRSVAALRRLLAREGVSP